MEALKLLFSSDFGLLSLGAIVFMLAMAGYIGWHVTKLMNAKPGKEGWDWRPARHAAPAADPYALTGGGRSRPCAASRSVSTASQAIAAVASASAIPP